MASPVQRFMRVPGGLVYPADCTGEHRPHNHPRAVNCKGSGGAFRRWSACYHPNNMAVTNGAEEMKNGWQLPLAALVLVVLFASFVAKPMASAADIAAWVQGIGSLFAIGAAVWIYAKQYQDKKADELADTRAFVQSIHTELSTLWTGYSLNSRAKLLGDIREKGFIYHVFPINPDALIVYNSTVAKIAGAYRTDLCPLSGDDLLATTQ
jgi:hypothetical protein